MNLIELLINKIRKYKLNKMFPIRGQQPSLRKHTILNKIMANFKVDVSEKVLRRHG